MRFRHLFLIGGTLAVLAALFLTDPDKGQATGLMLLAVATGVIAVGFAHLGRKALHDYPEADARKLFDKAGQHPVGSGLALVALSIVAHALLGLFGSVARADTLPERARIYIPVLVSEYRTHWPEHPNPPLLAGMAHTETCITDRHRMCWSPQARLKSAREEGAGLGQLTRTWRADGSVRFDALAEMRQHHPALRALSWGTIYDRPDLQLRALVLKARQDYGALAGVRSVTERATFGVAAYNRGLGGVMSERRACQVTPGCDPQRWFDHVSTTCTASRAPLYGGRSACDINRAHVAKAVAVADKYREAMHYDR